MSAMWDNIQGGEEVDRREYKKQWYLANKERIKSKERENARREALAALDGVKKLDATHYILRTKDGQYYILCGSKS